MFNSDTFANRPAFGIVGRIFISTDTKEFFRDTGTSWELIGGPGSGTITGSGTTGTLPIWTSSSALGNSTLIEGATLISTTKDIKADAFYLTGAAAANGALYWTSDRVTLANYNAGGIVHIEVNGGTASTIFGTDLSLTNNGYISAVPTLTAANNASSVAIVGVNTLSYAAAFSANNIGAIYGAITGFNLQTFAGNATFANSNIASGGSSVNSIDFSSGGSTITMTQSSGIRVMSGQQNLFQYQGTNSGTITHAAISQNTGFYRPTAATGILTITNAYSHLINALDDYGAGFTFTNRWGIYQAGASDLNYFAANMLVGSTINNGSKLQVTGAATISTSITAASLIKSGGTSSQYLMADGSTSTLTNPVTGTGTTNYIPKFTGTSTIGNSIVSESGSTINIAGNIVVSGGNNLRVLTTTNATTGFQYADFLNTSGTLVWGINGSAANGLATNSFAYGGVIYANNTLQLGVDGDMKMTLNAAGNLLVGTTTDGGQKLQVNGTGLFNDDIFLLAGKKLAFSATSFITPEDNIQGARIKSNGGLVVDTALSTFTTSVNIGNSVAVSVAAPSTHKVAILIGGVQYYLLASNV
jgi:hypothetical protein